MALDFDQISAITQKKFIPKMVDNIFDSDPLLQRLKKKSYKAVNGGTEIVQPLMYAQLSSAGWYQGADTLNTTDNETFTAAKYTWKQAYANITVSGRDERINSGDAQMVDFVKSKTMLAEKTLIDILSDGLYSDGTTAKSIVGLQDICDTSSTIGGISQSTYSWWQAYLNSSDTTLSLSVLQTMDTTLSKNNEGPTVYMATRANYNRYYALLQPQQRFMDEETAKGGFTSLMFNGKPFIAGSKVPTNNVFGLNEAYLHLYYHPKCDMLFVPFERPNNQDVRVAKVLWMGALGSSNNRMHGRCSALAA